jgi:integrase
VGALRQTFGYGVALGVVASNPVQGVKAPRRSKDDQTPVTLWQPAHLLRFRDHADDDPMAAAWRLSLSGLRRSEVLGLRYSSVDWEAGTVEVKRGRVALRHGRTATDDAKSRASNRVVPVEQVHPGTMALLRALRARQAEDRLAAGRRGSTPTYSLSTRSAEGSAPTGTARRSGSCAPRPGFRRSVCTRSGTRWRRSCTTGVCLRLRQRSCSGTASRPTWRCT